MKLKAAVPLIAFIMLTTLLAVGLGLDPREVPSPYIGKPAPNFILPTLHPAPNFILPTLHKEDTEISPVDMKGKVWLLNVWASWCGACRAEHDVLNRLVKNHQVKIVGLNYKDGSREAKQWLRKLGNPYEIVAVDRDGLAGIDWGVYGVPETFVIDQKGVIRYKNIGPVTQQDIDETIMPLIIQLKLGRST
jgi:cytochrome c biogenesis protein CcmG/thiol:disulfide interchange protein DsbE